MNFNDIQDLPSSAIAGNHCGHARRQVIFFTPTETQSQGLMCRQDACLVSVVKPASDIACSHMLPPLYMSSIKYCKKHDNRKTGSCRAEAEEKHRRAWRKGVGCRGWSKRWGGRMEKNATERRTDRKEPCCDCDENSLKMNFLSAMLRCNPPALQLEDSQGQSGKGQVSMPAVCG